MNNSSSNLSELFYKSLGSHSIIFDNIYLYFFAPYSLFCFVSTLITLICILDTAKCNHAIYKYFRLSVCASLLLCLLIFLNVFVRISRYTSFSYSYPARLFSCSIMFTLTITLYSFTNIINTLSTFYRLSNFVLKFAGFKNTNPYKLGSYVLVFFILLNMPLYFMNQTPNDYKFNQIKINLDLLRESDLCSNTIYGENSIFQVIFVIIFVINNVLTLAIELVSNLIATMYLKKFLKTNFTIRNIVTGDRIFKSALNENNADGSNNEESISNKILIKYPFIGTLFIFVLNLTHLVFSFVVFSQSDESSLTYSISIMIIYLGILIKHGNYIFFLYSIDINFKESLWKYKDFFFKFKFY
jgi:hypothetical protein